MEFRNIRKDRYIKLDEKKLDSYELPRKKSIAWCLAGGCDPYFKLSIAPKSTDIIMGITSITMSGLMKVPYQLDAYTRYAIDYGTNYIYIYLA